MERYVLVDFVIAEVGLQCCTLMYSYVRGTSLVLVNDVGLHCILNTMAIDVLDHEARRWPCAGH